MYKKILLSMLLLSTIGLAQGRGPRGGMDAQNMDAVRIWKLTEVLELTEEQTSTFLPMMQIHERKIRAAQKEIQEMGQKGADLLEKGDVSQKDVDKMIKNQVQQMEKIHKIKQEFLKTLPKYLTPEQQLLYLGFEFRFRDDLRQYMKDRQGRERGKLKTDRSTRP